MIEKTFLTDVRTLPESAHRHAEYSEGSNVAESIAEDGVAERVSIDSDREMIASIGNDDHTTLRMVEGILAMVEAHADDWLNLQQAFGNREP